MKTLREAIAQQDYHVHTFLSPCSKDENCTVTSLARRADELGIRTIVIADHWHEARPGFAPPPFYGTTDQSGFEATMREAEALEADVETLVACEIDMIRPGLCTVSEELARKLPVVLVSASHYHLKGIEQPEDRTIKGLVAHVLRRMRAAIEWPPTQILAHPLISLGNGLGPFDAVVEAIPEQELLDVLGLAEERNVAIELGAGVFCSELWSPEGQLCFYRQARQAGCKISPASDAHQVSDLGRASLAVPWAERAGFAAGDVITRDWLRRNAAG